MSTLRVTTTLASSDAKTDHGRKGNRFLPQRFNPSSSTPSWQVLDQGTPRVLVVDSDHNHTQQILGALGGMGLAIETCADLRCAVLKLRANGAHYDLVVVNISNPSRAWGHIIHELQEAACQSSRRHAPFFLCVSTFRPTLQLQLALEQEGARVTHE